MKASSARSRTVAAFAVLAALLVCAFVVGVGVGSVYISPAAVVRALTGHGNTEVDATIVRQIRVPRSIAAAGVGTALGVAGLQLQSLFRNSLADPFVLGVSSGASFGVALVVLGATRSDVAFLGGLDALGHLGVAAAGVVGAAVTTMLVLAAARFARSAVSVLIVGLMCSYAISSFVTVLVAWADAPRVQEFLAWEAGSFRSVTWPQLRILIPTLVVGLVAAAGVTKQLNALLLGEQTAATLGVDVARTRRRAITASALLVGVSTAFCGPIAFLGLGVPHLGRAALRTDDQRLLLPASMLVGATLAILADVVTQVPGSDFTIPLNAVTALIGAPVVFGVVLRSRHAGVVGA
ncbi:MAG TPA: iron ABC transporter permease [Acidimicrobiia bacterium]|nr:iron ABC transporter permease [Acidimicrobiia bacterium]